MPNLKPKINDKFYFDDGTIGTITEKWKALGYRKYPVVVVHSEKFGYSTFAVAAIELFKGTVTDESAIGKIIWNCPGD